MDIYYFYYAFVITIFFNYILDINQDFIILNKDNKNKDNIGCKECNNYNYL